MKWSELDSKDKVQLILERVMSYHIKEPYSSLWGFPVARWDQSRCKWGIGEIPGTYARKFDPLDNLNDAWQLVELEKWSSVEVKRNWLDNLAGSSETHKYSCLINVDGKLVCSFNNTAQEAICIAALMAVGVEIEP